MLKISFEFDEVTQKVSNVVVTNPEGKAIRQKRSKKSTGDNKPIVEVDENKIVLSDTVLEMLDADAGDRILINYHTVDNQVTFPLIGKSESFADPQSGNKLTKSNTVSFKGRQREILLEYGSLFTLELFDEGIYKLIPIESSDEVVSASPEVKADLSTEEEELQNLNDSELDEELRKLEFEDLPF